MAMLPGIQVTLHTDGEAETRGFTILADYYEDLKDELDRGAKGWREFDTPHGGKALIKLEHITDLFLVTPEYVEAREQWEAEHKQL